MDHTTDKSALRKEGNTNAFDQWLAKPETKLVISMVPACDPPEAMQTLLRSCFDCGVVHGEGTVALMMIEAMFENPPKEQGR